MQTSRYCFASQSVDFRIFSLQVQLGMAYKLLYFNIKGLAEPIRYLFSYGKVEYEDERIENPEEWAKIKNCW